MHLVQQHEREVERAHLQGSWAQQASLRWGDNGDWKQGMVALSGLVGVGSPTAQLQGPVSSSPRGPLLGELLLKVTLQQAGGTMVLRDRHSPTVPTPRAEDALSRPVFLPPLPVDSDRDSETYRHWQGGETDTLGSIPAVLNARSCHSGGFSAQESGGTLPGGQRL